MTQVLDLSLSQKMDKVNTPGYASSQNLTECLEIAWSGYMYWKSKVLETFRDLFYLSLKIKSRELLHYLFST